MNNSEDEHGNYLRAGMKYSLIGLGFSVLSLVLYIFHQESSAYLVFVGEWAKSSGWLGMFVFGALDALFVMSMLPGMIFTIMAGAIWGLVDGMIVAGLGKWFGAVLAFGVGKIACSQCSSFFNNFPNYKYVMDAVERTDWKIPLFLRLSPLIPYNLLNYALAATGISTFTYLWTSFLGMIPGTLGLVYMGSVAGNIAKSIEQGDEFTIQNFVLIIVSFALTSFFMWLTHRTIAKEMEKSLAMKELPR